MANRSASTVRWRIMVMVAVVNMLPSLGRLSLGITAKSIQEEFYFNTTTMGWVLSAFWLGYALFQVPGGWAGDRYGPRRVLTLSILWYSLFIATMALVPRLPVSRWLEAAWALSVIQFLIGAGEAFTAPNSAKLVGSWMSRKKLGLGISFTTLGIGVGGTLTPIFIVSTMQRWGWRTSFWLCSLIGVAIALVWGWYVTDRPEEHRHVNDEELALITCEMKSRVTRPKIAAGGPGSPPWRRMVTSRSIWALLISYMCRAYPMYFFNTWFFLYLVRERGLTIVRGGIWSATPFLAVLVLSPIGGWLSDVAVRSFGKRRGRQATAWLGMGCSTLLIWVGFHAVNNTLSILLVATGAGFNMFANVTWWAVCIDMMPNYAGSLSGLMSMCGGIAGWFAPIITGYIAASFGWSRALDLIAVLSLSSGLLWYFVNADTNIEEKPGWALSG